MSKLAYIIEVPDATDFDAFPGFLNLIISALAEHVPGWTMPGTRSHNGKRVVEIRSHASLEDLEAYFSDSSAISASGWAVLACQDYRLTRDPETQEITAGVHRAVPLSFLDYVADSLDENGDPLPRPTEPVTLAKYMGSDDWEWV